MNRKLLLIVLTVFCWGVTIWYFVAFQDDLAAAWYYARNTPQGEITAAKAFENRMVFLPLQISFILSGLFTYGLAHVLSRYNQPK